MPSDNQEESRYDLSKRVFTRTELEERSCERLGSFYISYYSIRGEKIPNQVFVETDEEGKKGWRLVKPKNPVYFVRPEDKTMVIGEYTADELIDRGYGLYWKVVEGGGRIPFFVSGNEHFLGVDIIFERDEDRKWRATQQSKDIIRDAIEPPVTVPKLLECLGLE